MFGVDKSGRDVLTSQFRKGGGSGMGRSEALLHRDPEQEMALMTAKLTIKKNTKLMSKIRMRANEVLSRNLGRHPQETEVQQYIESRVNQIAEKRVNEHRERMAEIASQAAILHMR